MLKIDISKKSARFIDSLSGKQQRQISQKIISLSKDPYPHDSKQLKGYDLLRTDIGEYRIVYKIVDNILLVIVLVGKRNDDDVYKKLKRMV